MKRRFAQHRLYVIPQRGFTLIEMLLVIVVSGLIVSIASLVLNTGSDAKNLSRQTELLEKTFNLAADEAVYRGTHLGFSIQQAPQTEEWVLLWFKWNNNQWEPQGTENSRVFSPYTFSSDIEPSLWVEGDAIQLQQVASRIDVRRSIIPQVTFYNSGEVSAFSLALADTTQKQSPQKIVMDMLGRTLIEDQNTQRVGLR